MRSLLVLTAISLFCWNSLMAQSHQWTWIGGDTIANKPGVYGIQNIPDAANMPGARMGGSVWKDLSGNFWLFGGFGCGEGPGMCWRLNDLWRYNTVTNEWTWVKGTKTINAPDVYGTKGLASPATQPGGRQQAITFTDNAGNLWLYGGFDASVMHNTLWKFNTTSNEWTWVSGDHTPNDTGFYGIKGVASPLNRPRARFGGVGWRDTNGNLWIFGGWGDTAINRGGRLNDLWKYDMNTQLWTWMKGDSTIHNRTNWGTKGVESPTNTPGSRIHPVAWTDHSGNFWLFSGEGGYISQEWGILSEYRNDLWRFNPSTNNWTWMSGDSVSSNTITPTFAPQERINSTGAVDAAGDLWLFGGKFFNDLWRYDVSLNQWFRIRGNHLAQTPNNGTYTSYGTKGVTSSNTDPQGLSGAFSWFDNAGNFWLFGGEAITPWPPKKFNTLLKLTTAPMPVNLLSFTGSMENQSALLRWKVENELNLSGYELQRSINGREFIKVASITAIHANDYSYADPVPSLNATTIYYRLKMIDKDGSSMLSNIVTLRLTPPGGISVYPNPANHEIYITTKHAINGLAEVQVRDVTGKLVVAKSRQQIASGYSIPVSQLSPGMYLLMIYTMEGSFCEKFTITR